MRPERVLSLPALQRSPLAAFTHTLAALTGSAGSGFQTSAARSVQIFLVFAWVLLFDRTCKTGSVPPRVLSGPSDQKTVHASGDMTARSHRFLVGRQVEEGGDGISLYIAFYFGFNTYVPSTTTTSMCQ